MKTIISILLTIIICGCAPRIPQTPSRKANPALSIQQHPQPVSSSEPAEGNTVITEPTGELSLAQALQLTLAHHPELQSMSYQLQAAQAHQQEAGYWQNPEIGIEIEDVGGSGDFQKFKRQETTLILSQLIELSGKAAIRRQIAELETEQVRMDLAARQLAICRDLTRCFIELVFYRDKLTLSEELQANARSIIESIEKRVRAGKDSSLELARARLNLAHSTLRHEDIVRNYQAKRQELALFWSSDHPLFTEATGQLEMMQSVPSLESLYTALDTNPAIINRAIEIHKRQTQLTSARVRSIPDLTLSGGARYYNESDDHAFLIGLELPIPIPGINRSRTQQAQANLEMARSQARAGRIALMNDLNQWHSELSYAQTRLNILRHEVLTPAREIFDAYKSSYDQGRIDYLTLLDAQRNWFASRDEAINAMTRYHIARTELECLIGGSLESVSH